MRFFFFTKHTWLEANAMLVLFFASLAQLKPRQQKKQTHYVIMPHGDHVEIWPVCRGFHLWTFFRLFPLKGTESEEAHLPADSCIRPLWPGGVFMGGAQKARLLTSSPACPDCHHTVKNISYIYILIYSLWWLVHIESSLCALLCTCLQKIFFIQTEANVTDETIIKILT